MGGGELYIYSAASAAANAVVTPTLKFQILNTGNAEFSGQIKTTFSGQSISVVAAGTGSVRMQLQNNSIGNSGVCVESSTGGDQFGGTTAYAMAIGTYTAKDFFIGTNSAQRLMVTSGGNILMGTTTDNGERLYVSGAIRATSTITANSDIRIKSNITKIENALEKVGQISGYTYNTNYDEKRHGGVIAQEIDKVFPEIVNTGNDGLMGVEYGNISALLIEAIKEQNIKIKNLETLLASK
jgi:hypothetical protein